MEKSSVINLPEIDDVNDEILKDEKIISDIITILISSAANVINNTILKKYISTQQVKENIERHAKKIEIDKGYVGDAHFGRNTLYISEYFFSKPVRNSIYQNSNLNEYPEMIKLLEIIGLTTAVSDTTEDMGYNIGTNETRDVFIKSLIANYFATSYDKSEKKEISFAERTFKSYAVSNALQVNMIYALSYIIGEDALAEALVSNKTEEVLSNKIDEITNKQGLGKEFIDNIRQLNIISKQLMGHDAQYTETQRFFQEKINPFIKELKNQSTKLQFFITTFLEQNNYDLKDYNFHHHPINVDFTFTKDDIEFIEYYLKRFEDHAEQSRKEKTNFTDFFYTETPEVKPRNNSWYEEDFSFINKIVTEMNIDTYFYNQSRQKLDNATMKCINLLTETIIPKAIKNKRLNQNKEEFENMLSFLTYKNSSIEKSKKGQRQIQKVKKKIDKQAKKRV